MKNSRTASEYRKRWTALAAGALLALCTVLAVPSYSGEKPEMAEVELDRYLTDENGKRYVIDQNGSTLFYNKDGSTYTKKIKGKEKMERRHFVLRDPDTGKKREGYCVEYNADVKVGTEYSGKPFDHAAYFRNLPKEVKSLLAAVTFYGDNGKNPPPYKGARANDFYFATQMVIWEVQQQLRVIDRGEDGLPEGTKLVSHHGMDRDFFRNAVKGRSAQKCYDHIVDCLDRHYDYPDFVGDDINRPEPIMLKYDRDGRWRAVLDDGGRDFHMKTDSRSVDYEFRDGKHHFSTVDLPDGACVLRGYHSTGDGSSADDLLIWNADDPGKQVLSTGSARPPQIIIRIRTDTPAVLTIEKRDAGTGRTIEKEGTEYRVKSAGDGSYVYDETYVTDGKGIATPDSLFPQGRYLLEEVKAPEGYVRNSEAVEFTVDGKTEKIELIQEDEPQKGVINIVKTGVYPDGERPLGGIDFDIMAMDDIVTADGTLRAGRGQVVDTVRTDIEGRTSSEHLHLGRYSVVEKNVPEDHTAAGPAEAVLAYGGQDLETVKADLEIVNTFRTEPATGDEEGMDFILLAGIISLTMIITLSLWACLRRE